MSNVFPFQANTILYVFYNIQKNENSRNEESELSSPDEDSSNEE